MKVESEKWRGYMVGKPKLHMNIYKKANGKMVDAEASNRSIFVELT